MSIGEPSGSTTGLLGWSDVLSAIHEPNCDRIDGDANNLEGHRHRDMAVGSTCIFKRTAFSSCGTVREYSAQLHAEQLTSAMRPDTSVHDFRKQMLLHSLNHEHYFFGTAYKIVLL